jgi:hypothetical protein
MEQLKIEKGNTPKEQALLDGYIQDFIDGTLSEGKFISVLQKEFGYTKEQAAKIIRDSADYLQ